MMLLFILHQGLALQIDGAQILERMELDSTSFTGWRSPLPALVLQQGVDEVVEVFELQVDVECIKNYLLSEVLVGLVGC